MAKPRKKARVFIPIENEKTRKARDKARRAAAKARRSPPKRKAASKTTKIDTRCQAGSCAALACVKNGPRTTCYTAHGRTKAAATKALKALLPRKR